jgi:hypothetical protein
MMRNGRFREDAARSVERRRREDEAPRLLDQVPQLKTLRLEMEERRGDTRLEETKHVRNAPRTARQQRRILARR